MTDDFYVDVNYYDEVQSRTFNNKAPIAKYFIITYGPPGSGKSSLLRLLYNNLVRRDETVVINVDDIVQRHPDYAKSRDSIQSKVDPIERSSKLEELYFKYRQKADIISDRILDKSLLDGYHIVWETTGNRIAWALKEIDRIKRHGYKIVLFYPLVNLNQLIIRLAKRQNVQTGPREITEIFNNSVSNFETIMNFIDRLIIIDNTKGPGEEMIILDLTKEYTGNYLYGDLGLKSTCSICLIKRLNGEGSVAKILGTNIYNKLLSMCGNQCG